MVARGTALGFMMLLAAAVGASDNTAGADGRPATATAAYETALRERIWDGTVEAKRQSTVSAQTSARVSDIYFDVGDAVERGQVIMRLTDVEQHTRLKKAEAATSEARARHEEAKREFQRIENMFQQQTVPRARYDQARADLKASTARLAAAQSNVAAAREQLEYTVIRAPYGGVVAKRHVEIGEHVAPGQALMTGFSPDELRVNIDVPQSMVGPIRKLRKAFVYVDDVRISAPSLRLFPIADPLSNTFRVRVNLPTKVTTLYPGMFVKVGFIVGETQRLLIPDAAVVRRSELTAVYVLTDDAVYLRQLRLGSHYGTRVEVLAGLAAGDRFALDPVAAAGYLKSRPGVPGSGYGGNH